MPPELERSFGTAVARAPLVFLREVHLVDDIPIGLTESWTTHAAKHASHGGTASDQRDVIAECFAEIGFATTVQAELLQSYLDIPLIVVHARSVLADTRHLVELSRTSWLASRVRLAYIRNLHLGEIDSLQLLTES